jgi:hypothetical protein
MKMIVSSSLTTFPQGICYFKHPLARFYLIHIVLRLGYDWIPWYLAFKWPILPATDDRWEKWVLAGYPDWICPMPYCPAQIPHEPTRKWMWAAAVRSWQLVSWAMAWFSCYLNNRCSEDLLISEQVSCHLANYIQISTVLYHLLTENYTLGCSVLCRRHVIHDNDKLCTCAVCNMNQHTSFQFINQWISFSRYITKNTIL